MYIRFVVQKKHHSSQKRLGVFHAIRYLRDDKLLTPTELKIEKEIMDWFGKNLEVPKRFAKSKNKMPIKKAISWFRDTAIEHIQKMEDLTVILKAHNIPIEILETSRPGYIVYEDEFQVTAEPFKETVA